MVNVKNRKCENLGCMKEPYFNVPGSKAGRFCSKHKHAGMVDVKNKRCEHPGCKKRPYFNDLGSNDGMFCSEHKEAGVVDNRILGG